VEKEEDEEAEAQKEKDEGEIQVGCPSLSSAELQRIWTEHFNIDLYLGRHLP